MANYVFLCTWKKIRILETYVRKDGTQNLFLNSSFTDQLGYFYNQNVHTSTFLQHIYFQYYYVAVLLFQNIRPFPFDQVPHLMLAQFHYKFT